MKTKNWLVFGMVSAMTLGMLTGCQSKETAAETEATQEADNGSEVTEDAAENEAVEEVTEEAAQEVAFAEANGLQFSDLSSLEIPGFLYFEDENGNYTEDGLEGVSLIQPTFRYTFGDITVSEPDEDGNVVYTISYTKEGELAYEGEGNFNMGFISTGLSIMDYYTGTVFAERDLQNDDSYDIYTDVVWDDVTYSVGYTKSISWDSGGWQQDESGINRNLLSGYTICTITAPADYDGLVLCIDNRGNTEYEEQDVDNVSEAHIFGTEEDESFDDCTFIRVSDYVTN
jgi:hypothetical protein